MEKKNGKTMKGLPISERPYEKVLEKGPVSLSDAELLSVILALRDEKYPGAGHGGGNLKCRKSAGLAGLLHGTVEDYKEIRGVGEVKAIQLACIGELSARIWKAAASEKTIVFDAPVESGGFLYGGNAPFRAGELKASAPEHEKYSVEGHHSLQGNGECILRDTAGGSISRRCASGPAGSSCSTTIPAGTRHPAGKTASSQNGSGKQGVLWESRF